MALVEYFSLILLVFLCIVTVDLSISSSGLYGKKIGTSPLRVFIAVFLPAYICRAATKKNRLTVHGGAWAYFIGVVLTLTSYTYMTMMLVFFYSSTRLTKFRQHLKSQVEHSLASRERGNGGRTWHQVVSNGGIPCILSLICMIDFGLGVERPVDFGRNYSGSWYDLAVLGALASATGDTWASELGSVLGPGSPVLITTFRSVPRGTNGGVSLLGTLFSALGGLVIGITHWICIQIWSSEYSLSNSQSQYLVIIVGTLAGFVGSLIDSFFGATLQYSGYSKVTEKVVDEPGEHVIPISGCDCLTNNSVNLLSCFCTSLLAPLLGFKLWLK